MYAKSTRASAKREVQKERSAKRDDRIARPRRAQICERSELCAKRAMRMCPRSGQIFLNKTAHVVHFVHGLIKLTNLFIIYMGGCFLFSFFAFTKFTE